MRARDGATGSVSGNYTNAAAALFVNPAAGDLHLKPTATVLLNQVATPPAAAGVGLGRPITPGRIHGHRRRRILRDDAGSHRAGTAAHRPRLGAV